MSRDMVCLKCPLPDCLPHDPGCLRKEKKEEGKIGEENISFPVGLRIVAQGLGVAYETIRYRIKMRQWDALPELFRTGPRGDWRCTREALEDFLQKMRGGAA